MSVIRNLSIGVSAIIAASAADAQTVITEPVPNELDGVVRAQYIKPGDVSPEEYEALLKEAEKVKKFQQSQGQTVYSPGSTSENTKTPSAQPRIELFEAPVSQEVTLEIPDYSQPASRSHEVVKGDTLYSISKRYGVTLNDLKAANGLEDNKIKLGQLLIIPGTSTSRVMESIATKTPTTLVRTVEPIPAGNIYAVLPGDTLYGISRQACISVADLSSMNNLGGNTNLKPGQKLTLPGGHCLK